MIIWRAYDIDEVSMCSNPLGKGPEKKVASSPCAVLRTSTFSMGAGTEYLVRFRAWLSTLCSRRYTEYRVLPHTRTRTKLSSTNSSPVLLPWSRFLSTLYHPGGRIAGLARLHTDKQWRTDVRRYGHENSRCDSDIVNHYIETLEEITLNPYCSIESLSIATGKVRNCN